MGNEKNSNKNYVVPKEFELKIKSFSRYKEPESDILKQETFLIETNMGTDFYTRTLYKDSSFTWDGFILDQPEVFLDVDLLNYYETKFEELYQTKLINC